MTRNLHYKRAIRSSMAIGISLLLAAPAFAARNVDVDIDAQNAASGVNVSITGDVNAVYQYTVYDGQSVNDTIPVRVCMTTSEADWTSIGVSFGTTSGNLPGVTLPAIQTFQKAATVPDCRDLSIGISSGALILSNPEVAQNFIANFNASDTAPVPSTGALKPQVRWADVKNFKVQVTVLPVTSNVSCFLTDSEGNLLNDCSGVPVTESGSSDGRFAIVANKRQTQVATNPGQFYYNLIWHNKTGAARVVDIDFDRVGLVSKGQQAIHAAIFNGYLDPLTPEDFAAANELGVPEGSDDTVTGITVPAGSSLLVTYHLEWAGLGQPLASGCAGNCADANQQAYVIGQVNGDGVASESCKAEAFGYKK